MTAKILSLLFVVVSLGSSAKPPAWSPYPPTITCSLEDSKGNLWFGSAGDGIYYYNPSRKKDGFRVFKDKTGLSSNTILSILEDKTGIIWFGTKHGLCKYDPKSDSTGKNLITFNEIPLLVSNSTYFNDSKETSELQREIWSMAQDKTGRIWLGTNDGVFHFQPVESNKKPLFTYFLQYDQVNNPNNLKLSSVTSVLEDRNGKIWFTTWFEGICCFDGKSVTNYTPEQKVWFATIFEDKNGDLWVGSRDHGVYYHQASSDSIRSESFVNYFPDMAIFNTCAVPSITQDKSGNMWFGTEFGDLSAREDFGGLWCYSISGTNPKKNLFTNYTFQDGLPNNSLFDLLIDKSGKIWIGTRGGLCCLDKYAIGRKKQRFTNYQLKTK